MRTWEEYRKKRNNYEEDRIKRQLSNPNLPSNIKSNIKRLENEYKQVSDKQYEGYKAWKKRTRENDNVFQKVGGFLDDMFWGGDKRYYNKKYGNPRLNEINKQIKDEEQRLIQNKLKDEKTTNIEKFALPISAGAEQGITGLKTAINKAGSLLPGQSMENYDSRPSYIQQKYQKVRQDTKNKPLNIYQDLAYTTGNMAPSMVAPNPTTALATTGATSFGTAYNQAKQEGKTESQATKYGILSGSSEALLQKALGGVSSVYGKSALGKQLGKTTDKVLGKLIKSPTIKNLIAESGSEFTEEYLQEVLEPVFRNIAFDENNKIKPFSEEALYSGFLGALNSGLINGANVIATKNMQQNLNQPIDNRLPVNQEVVNVEDTIQPNLPIKQDELAMQPDSIEQTSVQELVEQQSPETTPFKHFKSENENINKLNESISKYFNNTQKTKDLSDTISKLINDKGYAVVFDDTIVNPNGNFVNAQITTKNGTTEIKINPNSPRAVEFLMIHEVTHAIETNKMKDLVMNYAKNNVEFNNALENLKETYGTTDVSDEVLADISGQLFGNQEFINNLSMEQPNVFRRIYNKIVEIANKITGNSNEALFIRDLKNKWEEAYRNNESSKSDRIRFSEEQVFEEENDNINYRQGEVSEVDGFHLDQAMELYESTEFYNDEISSKAYEIIDNMETYALQKVEALIELDKIIDKENLEYSGSPYSFSSYGLEPGGKIDWGSKPVGSYRVSDHWNFYSYGKTHCELTGVEEYTQAVILARYNGKTYDIIKDFTKDLEKTENELYNEDKQKSRDEKRKQTYEFRRDITSEDLDSMFDDLKDWYNDEHEKLVESIEEEDVPQESLDFFEKTFKNGTAFIEDDLKNYFENQTGEVEEIYTNYVNVLDNYQKYHDGDRPTSLARKKELENMGMPKYSQQPVTDNKGRELSPQQQEFFKDSKVRDENGNLLEVYHGTANDFTKFSDIFMGQSQGNALGQGYYFTSDKNTADVYRQYSKGKNYGKVMELYINIKNPFNIYPSIRDNGSLLDQAEYLILKYDKPNIDSSAKGAYLDYVESKLNKNYKAMDYIKSLADKNGIKSSDILQELGYDGIVADKEYVVFNSNQIKNVDNTNPTENEDIRYSQKGENWQQYLEKYFKSTGKKTFTKEINLPVNKNLTRNEYIELDILKNVPFDLSNEEQKRLDYLEAKKLGKKETTELKENIKFSDIKQVYSKYKNLDDFDNSLVKTAEGFVPGYRNTNKRTKNDWLSISNFIGSNFKGDAKKLEKYAIQSWHYLKPNQAQNLNRQGKKYVKFTIEDWVNSMYKGYGKTTKENPIIKEYISKETTKDILPTKETTTQEIKVPVKNNLNPLEISKLTKQDVDTTPILPTKKVETGEGKSKFARNIQKSDMLSQKTKDIITSNEDFKFYKKVTNEESLAQAQERLEKGGSAETLNWLGKDSKNADSTDVAEGWILLKQYQDKINQTTNVNEKQELNRSLVQVAKKMRDIGTKAGQSVQAFNIMQRLTPEGMVYYAQSELDEAYNKAIKNKTQKWIDQHKDNFELTQEETQFIMDTMNEIKDMPDGYEKQVKLAEIQKTMTDKLPPEKGAGLKAWMRISMLFNPKTQVRNVLGNAVILPVNMVGDKISSQIDKQIAKTTGVRTKGDSYKGYLENVGEGIKQSYSEAKKGISTRDIDGNRFEIGTGKSFNDNTKLGKALNKTDNILSFMLDAGDRGFYKASFETSLNNQMKANNVTTPTPEMVEIATNEALSRTWQDNNNYTKFVLNVRKMLNNNKAYGMGDILIPFAKTPANLTKAIVDYSPVGLVNSLVKGNNLKKSIETGQFTPQMQHSFVDSLGKATAGTMLYILGTALAKAGITTGDNDDDKDVANFMRNTLGKNSYSIKLGDKSFSYSWAQPLASPLAITSNIVKKKKEDANLLETILSNLDVAGDVLLEQSFMESINTALNNRDGIVTGLKEALFDLPSRAIPTVFKQIADIVDSTQRTSFEYDKPIETAKNKIKSKLPFVSKGLAPSVDTLGRDIEKYGGKNNLFNVFLNPANISSENVSKSAEEIYRIYQQTGDKKVMPRVAPYYINQKGEKITLSSKQKAEYQRISGKIVEDNVKNLLNNSTYKSMDDTEKAEIITDIVNYSYNKAREDVLNIPMSQTYNKINSYVNDGGKPSNYYIDKEEIDYSYENPSKYATIKKITSYDNYQKYNDKIKDIKEETRDSKERKSKVIGYINSLKLNIPQKAMLIKMNYSSFRDYDNQIFKYINDSDLTKQEKIDILNEVGIVGR